MCLFSSEVTRWGGECRHLLFWSCHQSTTNTYTVDQPELETMFHVHLNPNDTSLNLADCARNVGEGHGNQSIIYKEVCDASLGS